MRPKILIDDKIPFIKGRLEHCADVDYLSAQDILAKGPKDANGLIVRTRTICNSDTLSAFSQLQIICTATIGTDHIDETWCSEKGIKVINAAGCNAPGVAQYVWSALCNCRFDASIHKLGIVGVGNVGSIVAEWAKNMGCKVLAYDPFKTQELAKRGIATATLDRLMKDCDAVTLHVPLTKTGPYPTFHFINDAALSLMKPGSIIINASRGEVADTNALKKAAHNGVRLVIDTWEDEPYIDENLLSLAKIATPHIAGYSLEGKQRATRMALEAIGKHFRFNPILEGLEGDYKRIADLSYSKITDGYDIKTDDAQLRQKPQYFEELRSYYTYRHEPK